MLLLIISHYPEKSYFKYECPNTECDWQGSCNRLKWVWQMETDEISKEKKIEDYYSINNLEDSYETIECYYNDKRRKCNS